MAASLFETESFILMLVKTWLGTARYFTVGAFASFNCDSDGERMTEERVTGADLL
jgi:hypothetical protein